MYCADVAGVVPFNRKIGSYRKRRGFRAQPGIAPVAPEVIETINGNQNTADEFHENIIRGVQWKIKK
jgi:hypothetical protein